MKKYTHKEMQERLPDYAFGKLLGEEKETFESSLNLYIDLQEELEETLLLFKRIEETDFSVKMQKKSKNISVEVQKELSTGKPRSRNIFSKVVVPTLGLVIMGYILFFTEQFAPQDQQENYQEKISEYELINQDDLLALGTDFDFVDYVDFVGNVSSQFLDFSLEDNLDFMDLEMDISSINLTNDEIIENINDEEFETLLEGIYDAKIY
jgi:hypothetical protein